MKSERQRADQQWLGTGGRGMDAEILLGNDTHVLEFDGGDKGRTW